jgi:hypothetical protein
MIKAPKIDKDLAAVWYERGRAQGRIEGRTAALNEVTEFLWRMLAETKPQLPAAHPQGCYRRHPHCALKAVHAFVVRAGGET